MKKKIIGCFLHKDKNETTVLRAEVTKIYIMFVLLFEKS